MVSIIHKIINYIISGNVPLVYNIKNKKLAIDNDKVDIVKSIFDKFNSTHAIHKTTKYIDHVYSFNLYNATIKRMLGNKIYIGKYRNIKNYCSAIIDIELLVDFVIFLILTSQF